MGLTEPALYDDDETLARTLLGDARFERLWTSGWMRLDYPTPFVPFTDGFPTPSGKLEFSRETRRGGRPRPAARLHAARARRRTTSDHPLALIAPASHWFLNTIFANKPDLMQQGRRAARSSCIRTTRRRAGWQTGDGARVFNARGGVRGRGRGRPTACAPA